MGTEITAILVSAVVSGILSWIIAEKTARREFQRDLHNIRTEFMAETVVRDLLLVENWKKRSLKAIKSRLGGFDDDKLRRILVRAGAVKFYKADGATPDEKELWGLRDRNLQDLMQDH